MDEGLKEEYSYDNLNRLTDVEVHSSLLSTKDKDLSYTYDALGNLTDKNSLSISYKDNKPHQIDRVNATTYIYDNNGNLLKDDRHTFSYDPTDKVTSITQNSKTITFDYSSSMQRYQKMTNNQRSYTHYIGKLYESHKDNINSDYTTEKNYIYFGSKLIALKVRDINNKINPPKIYFFHYDNIGNIIAITDKDHKIIDRRSYTPFGTIRAIPYNEQLNRIPTLIERLKTTNRGFTAHEMIEETDIIHMNGRIYDTITGRFTSADPFIQAPSFTQSYNRYSYVMNNPVNFTDPSGYFLSGLGHWVSDRWNDIKHGADRVYKNVVHNIQDNADQITGGVLVVVGSVASMTPGPWQSFAPGLIATGGSLINGDMHLFNKDENGHINIGYTMTITTDFGQTDTKQPTQEMLLISQQTIYDADVAYNHKYLNGAMSDGFGYMYEVPKVENNPDILDIVGKVWALPNTIVGLIFGSSGYIAGNISYALGISENRPTWKFGHNALQFLDNPFMIDGTAITLGNTISYRNVYPSKTGSYGDKNVLFGRHEEKHTYQQQKLGIFFFPIYFYNGGPNLSKNYLEQEAQEYGRISR